MRNHFSFSGSFNSRRDYNLSLRSIADSPFCFLTVGWNILDDLFIQLLTTIVVDAFVRCPAFSSTCFSHYDFLDI
ncbi:hypothetical protein EUGRSUZ_G01254 [Eucalyptus grandis]|uniref:Uncharacterized protein n=2 Tax=Eucalyptus grandis TaxID=71139 RepID=A0ACC3K3C4_EUCGR|nr:hypothetical protein EUGRSUZ_G01254 [Eucalyptus grandis]